MAKRKTSYICRACHHQLPRWQGQCPACQEWNTLEAVTPTTGTNTQGYSGQTQTATLLSEVATSENQQRLTTAFTEFDRVLGGGIVAGSVVLVGGDPGIGKSSILLQIASFLSQGQSVLYVAGEESLTQIALRAKRMDLPTDRLMTMAETQVEAITAYLQTHQPNMVVIDSIQTMQLARIDSAAGGVSQIRESTAVLTQVAKQTGIAVFLVGHVTKSGEVAGPRVLEHIVDTVVFIEGQSDHRYRLVRTLKNRFGPVNELGVFAMTEKGMKAVKNPSAIFLNQRQSSVPGSAIISIWEGTRPLLVEVQALVTDNEGGAPRRLAVGIEPNRLAMMIAIVQRYLNLPLGHKDVFVNIVGGIKVSETAADLAIIAAIVSSLQDQPIGQHCLFLGEVGLSGEIRPVAHAQERLQEAQKHGFNHAIIPVMNQSKHLQSPLKTVTIERITALPELLKIGE